MQPTLHSCSVFLERFQERAACADLYNTLVIEDLDKQIIIGTTTLLLERKFLRACGLVMESLLSLSYVVGLSFVLHNNNQVGHIEDVVVNDTYRGKRLGQRYGYVLCLQ